MWDNLWGRGCTPDASKEAPKQYFDFILGSKAKYPRTYPPCLPGEAKVLNIMMESGATNMNIADRDRIKLSNSDVGAWHNMFDRMIIAQVNAHAPTAMSKFGLWMRGNPPFKEKIALWEVVRNFFQLSAQDTLTAGVWRALVTQWPDVHQKHLRPAGEALRGPPWVLCKHHR